MAPIQLISGSDKAGSLDSADFDARARENGETCLVAADCTSGICTDGLCCDKICSGLCQACDLPATKGKCSSIVSQEDSDCKGLQSCDVTGSCTDRFTEFPTLTSASGPLTVALGADGNLWFTESSANKIGRMSTLGAIAEYMVPTVASYPFGIAAGPDSAVWFTEFSGNKIGRVVVPGVFTEFDLPPVSIAAGPDGNLWFTENKASKIGRFRRE